jgi:hypothetical protein
MDVSSFEVEKDAEILHKKERFTEWNNKARFLARQG